MKREHFKGYLRQSLLRTFFLPAPPFLMGRAVLFDTVWPAAAACAAKRRSDRVVRMETVYNDTLFISS